MKQLEVGELLPEKIFLIDRDRLIAYANASGDQNPIHQNEEFARSVGLPDVIAHGMLTMGLMGTYISEIAGTAAVLELSARFTKPVVVPANTTVALAISATVVALDEGTVKLDVTAICDSVKVLGMAKAVISLA
jgi:acyl dehydratase